MNDFFERYDHQLIPEPNSGCLLWLGAAASAGYGHGHRDKAHFYAHRCAYESANGIGSADGLVVRHRCDTPACCNPDHLEVGTQRDNTLDSVARGRAVRALGERCAKSKLASPLVLEIRKLYLSGTRISDIRRILGLENMKHTTVSWAATGRTWKHITEGIK